MSLERGLCLDVLRVGFVLLLAAALAGMSACQSVRIDNDDLGGVVTSAEGPEAGVWVVAGNNRPAH